MIALLIGAAFFVVLAVVAFGLMLLVEHRWPEGFALRST